MNYNFFVFKFLLFILINFIFIFQIFFSLNFFFSNKFDEELVICFAIFFVFVLFINQIVTGLQDMLKTRVEIYLNIFLLVFKLLRKCLRRFKKHNNRTVLCRAAVFSHLYNVFFQNLTFFTSFQVYVNNYFTQVRLKSIIDSVMIESELKMSSLRKALSDCYKREIKYFNLAKFLQ
jgi:hypothetical protein